MTAATYRVRTGFDAQDGREDPGTFATGRFPDIEGAQRWARLYCTDAPVGTFARVTTSAGDDVWMCEATADGPRERVP